jgi:ammonia channel protein AmtB
MVGPSMTDEERQSANRRLQAGFVLVVGVSGGLVALRAGGTTVQLLAGLAGGLVVGLVMLWFLRRWTREFQPGRR